MSDDLQRARELAGDARFCGCAADALRTACKEKDADMRRAVLLLKQVRPPDRIVKTILQVPPADRDAFRRRMCEDFDGAVGRLQAASETTLRRAAGARAARDAQNWAGSSIAEKNANWERLFPAAMAEQDRTGALRGVSGDQRFVPSIRPTTKKIYGH